MYLEYFFSKEKIVAKKPEPKGHMGIFKYRGVGNTGQGSVSDWLNFTRVTKRLHLKVK